MYLITLFTYNLANVSIGSIIFMAKNMVDLINMSIIIYIASFSFFSPGNPNMKSIVMSHLHSRIKKGYKAPCGFWCSTFSYWQTPHLVTYSTIFFFHIRPPIKLLVFLRWITSFDSWASFSTSFLIAISLSTYIYLPIIIIPSSKI